MPDARITVPDRVPRGEPFEVRIQIRHAMETGYRTDDMGKSIPRNVIRTLTCRYNGDAGVRRAPELRHRGQSLPALFRHWPARPASSRSTGSTTPARGAPIASR